MTTKACKLIEVTAIRIMAEGDPGITQETMDAAIASAVAKATGSMSAKNNDLLDELKAAKDTLKSFDGLDAEDVRKTMDLFDQSEEAQMLKDGKLDEVLSKRTEKLRGEYDGKLADAMKAKEDAVNSGGKYEKLYKNKIVDDEIRKIALDAKVIPEALDDVLRRGRDVFVMGSDGSLEARDKDGNLLKHEDHLLTPKLFVESLKKSSPYYWPGSTGTGAGGSGAGGAAGDLDAQLADAAAKGDSKRYRDIRKKMSAV